MLELRNIVHNYDGKPLLDGINFHVNNEEVLCLLGSSGSGKSTILRLISGLEKPVSGDILYNGRSIINDPVHKRNFGMVFQDYALFPHMNVYENIAFGLKMKKLSVDEIEQNVSAALKQVGMEKFGSRKVTELSGGEQQRVALARSIVVHPSLLMLDEPLGALDYSLRQNLIGELKGILGKNGIPAIYVTHDQNEAMALSDRIAILHNGKIIQMDSPENLFNHPVNKWCAEFLGFHNYINGIIADNGEVQINNFDHVIYWNFPNKEKKQNCKVDILLKGGGVVQSSEIEHKDCLILKGIPVQNTYHGDYYDAEILIDENKSISIKSKDKLRTNEQVKLFFEKKDVIFYS